jgi:hypothetical protein
VFRTGIFLVLGVAICGAPAPARAHQSSVTYSSVEVGQDGRVSWALKLSTRDLFEALGLDRDRDASDEEIRAGEERLHAYVLARIRVAADGRPCPVTERALGIVAQTQRFAEVRYLAACPLPLERVELAYDLFFELDPRHTAMLAVTHGERTVRSEWTRGLSTFQWALALGPPASVDAAGYVWKGMEHIYTGYDHVAFVVGLVLVAAVRPARRGWEPRPPREAGPYVLKIVTAFTIAHSVTLILAALDVVTLPGRLVESAIAASIVYIAVENIVVREPSGRWPLAFVFGLIHGLGFAAMLRPLLPAGDIVLPLLLFNVGVEVGQLTIVAPLLALLWLAGRRAPGRYRRVAVVGGSALIGLLGLLWLVERVVDVDIISKHMG